jgi:hypothetical protein
MGMMNPLMPLMLPFMMMMEMMGMGGDKEEEDPNAKGGPADSSDPNTARQVPQAGGGQGGIDLAELVNILMQQRQQPQAQGPGRVGVAGRR